MWKVQEIETDVFLVSHDMITLAECKDRLKEVCIHTLAAKGEEDAELFHGVHVEPCLKLS